MKQLISIAAIVLLLLAVFSGPMLSIEAMAASKISTELHSTFSEIESTETTLAYVQMADVDHDAVMTEFAKLYPNEYNIYVLAKSGAKVQLTEEEELLLQRAVELKRSVYQQFYTVSNTEKLAQFYEADARVFVSAFAPIAIVETDRSSAMKTARSESTIAITQYVEPIIPESTLRPGLTSDEIVQHLDLSNQISRGNVLRDTYDLTGEGIKIGILEADGVPDVNDEYLQNANITIRPGDESAHQHATIVALILAAVGEDGTEHGLVPNASFYCAYSNNMNSLYYDVEWMISQGVNIINASLGILYPDGTYDEYSQWFDHIAAVHDVHIVTSSGNRQEYENGYIDNYCVSSPGMAYNAMVVGGFCHNGSDDVAGFTMYSDLKYVESGTVRPEKPNLIANVYFGDYKDGGVPTPVEGTSFSTPQVAGVIAQLCCWDGNLKFRQSVVGAVLAASAAEKVDAVGSGAKGDQFLSSIPGCAQLSDKEGAGILDALWAWGILANNNYWHLKLEQEDFPYEQTITINTRLNTISRVALYWTKDNSDIDHSTNELGDNNPALTNLDLYIYDSEGNLVASSTTLYNNCEIVQFVPTAPGTYTVKIVLVGTTSIKEYIGLALW